MNLHYSLTMQLHAEEGGTVLPSYEFTLLSNVVKLDAISDAVLPSYEFTLLSNPRQPHLANPVVLPSYEFTLLSNLKLVCISATLPRR